MKVRPIYDKLGYDSWYGKGIAGVPYYAAAQLPYQPNDTLLNQHLPPDPDRPNVRSTGSYTLRLLQERK